jgi:hypothetical protein
MTNRHVGDGVGIGSDGIRLPPLLPGVSVYSTPHVGSGGCGPFCKHWIGFIGQPLLELQ